MRPAFPRNSHPVPTGAFSLVELLAVLAIIAIMLSLLMPAVNSFNSTAGRAGAVNILMNTMEQARVAALESGRTVYLVLNRRDFPEQDRIMVLREPDPQNQKSQDYEVLSRWLTMPKGVLLHKVKKGIDVLSEDLPDSFNLKKSPFDSSERINVIAFNGSGAVSYPSTTTKLMLFVTEGVRGHGDTEALISANKEKAGGFEIISLRRYTGRASLEVTTL